MESNEPHVLAEAVRRMMADRPLQEAMSQRNRQKVREFDAEAIAGRYIELFREAGAP